MAITVRGQLWGSHCFVCRKPFTEDDRPTFTGRWATVRATGYWVTCKACREARPERPTSVIDQQAEVGRLGRVMLGQMITALRIPNLAKRLGMVPRY